MWFNFIIGDINIDHLIKMSTKFLHFKVTVSSFVLSSMWGDILRLFKHHVPRKKTFSLFFILLIESWISVLFTGLLYVIFWCIPKYHKFSGL